jgi:sugar-specific transcriptional regulator TrmB
MSVYIHAFVQLKLIDPDEWELCYLDALKIIKAFPLPLARVTKEKVLSKNRRTFTTDIIVDKGKKEEHLLISGDVLTYKHAEAFIIRRDIKQYIQRLMFDSPPQDKEVLWSENDEYLDYHGNGYSIWEERTQSEPYHFGVLALGMLLETRFPKNVYIIGDFDKKQIDYVIRCVKETSGIDLNVPVCYDSVSLWDRLTSLYETNHQILKRFKSLFRGSDGGELLCIATYFTYDETVEYFSDRFLSCKDFDDREVRDIIRDTLTLTNSVELCIKAMLLVAKKNKNDSFTLDHLFTIICNMDIVEHKKKCLKSQMQPTLINKNGNSDLGNKFLKVIDLLDKQKTTCVSKKSILDEFSKYQPKKRAVYEEILNWKQQKSIKDRVAVDKKIRSLFDSFNAVPASELPKEPETHGSFKYFQEIIRDSSVVYKNPTALCVKIADKLRTLFTNCGSDHIVVNAGNDRVKILKGIYAASQATRFFYTENGWNHIDKETDIEILKILLMYSWTDVNSNHEQSKFRLYLVDHPELWKYLKKNIKPANQDVVSTEVSATAFQNYLTNRDVA